MSVQLIFSLHQQVQNISSYTYAYEWQTASMLYVREKLYACRKFENTCSFTYRYIYCLINLVRHRCNSFACAHSNRSPENRRPLCAQYKCRRLVNGRLVCAQRNIYNIFFFNFDLPAIHIFSSYINELSYG